jgi:hypothetical protein
MPATPAAIPIVAAFARLSPPGRLDRLMREYERNYARLRLLIPDLGALRGCLTSHVDGMPELEIEVLEQAAYTTTLSIHYALLIDGTLHREPELRVRGYHDARLAEVLAIREPGPGGLPAWCSLRHSSLGRKWRFNRFLGKWLAYCMLQGHGDFVPGPPRAAARNSG